MKRAAAAVTGASPGEPTVKGPPDLVAASLALRAWATISIERGTQAVREQLSRVRAAGVIDAEGRRLVDLPDDMGPDSRTDV